MAAEDVDMEQSASQSEFEKLFASKVATQFGAAQHAEVSTLQEKLVELQSEYIEKQVMQNVMEKLIQVEGDDDLNIRLNSQERIQAEYRKRRAEMDAVVTERRLHISKIGELVEEIEREKENVAKREQSRPEFESELEKLKSEWKELQKRNAQRKAAIQMATGMMINNEDDCNRILESQTQELQELHEKQKRLEEKKVDLSTRVKQTTETIAALEKQNDIRSRDLQTKQREEECASLEHMKQWYQSMNQLLSSLTGIDITQITDDFMEVSVLKDHVVRLFFDAKSTQLSRVEFTQDEPDASDLAEIAIRTNNVRLLVLEYCDRIKQTRKATPAAI